MSQPWEELGISRATYFRRKSKSLIQKDHRPYKEEWNSWRDSGLYGKPRSENYRELQNRYLDKYFDEFKEVSRDHLERFLDSINPLQHSIRQSIHSSVSSMARYLRHIGELTEDEYLKIQKLYPSKHPDYLPEQRIIYEYELNSLLEASINNNHRRYQGLLNYTLLLFLSETGLRVSECTSLNMGDLSFHDSEPKLAYIRVRKGKGSKPRVVPFSLKAQVAVKEYLKHLSNERLNGREGAKLLFWSFNPRTGLYTAHT